MEYGTLNLGNGTLKNSSVNISPRRSFLRSWTLDLPDMPFSFSLKIIPSFHILSKTLDMVRHTL